MRRRSRRRRRKDRRRRKGRRRRRKGRRRRKKSVVKVSQSCEESLLASCKF